MSYTNLIRSLVTGSPLSAKDRKERKPVNITANIKSIVVRHNKHNMLVKRDADTHARMPDLFTKTSRPCPPFCIQPMKVSDNVETIGELEMLNYLEQTTEDDNDTLIIDSRMENWVSKGTIPCSINIPWTHLIPSQGANAKDILLILKHQFKVNYADDMNSDVAEQAISNGSISTLLDFSNAKKLVLFCNGAWCGQTSESIKALIKFGYPADKLKYFRNGMQGWVGLGLTTVYNDDEKIKLCKV